MEDILFGQTSCILLSAGSSERMGQPKALLRFQDGELFIQKIISKYIESGVRQIIVVVNSELYNLIRELQLPLSDKVEVVVNQFPERGRFFSFQLGAQHLKTGNYCFFQNIDNPFTSVEILKSLHQYREFADVIIPAFKSESGHPVLFSPAVAHKIGGISETDIRINQFLKTFSIRKIELSESMILVNINTPDDYKAACIGE